jgi:hypothetical protein
MKTDKVHDSAVFSEVGNKCNGHQARLTIWRGCDCDDGAQGGARVNISLKMLDPRNDR